MRSEIERLVRERIQTVDPQERLRLDKAIVSAMAAERQSEPVDVAAIARAQNEGTVHLSCDCSQCKTRTDAGYRRCAEEPGQARWTLMAEPVIVQVEPEPEIPPAPTRPPLELSPAEREAACAAGWLWSHEFRSWFYCEPL